MNFISFIRVYATTIGLYLLIALSESSPAMAALPNWQCEGNPVIQHENTINIELTGESQGGDLKTHIYNSGQAGTGQCNCSGSGSYYSLFTSATDLPSSTGSWLKLNDYIEAQVYINIYGAGDVLVPFNQVSNAGTSKCTSPSTTITGVATGAKGKVIFRLTKGVIGEVHFSGRLATLFWQLKTGVAQSYPDKTYPFAHIDADVSIKAIASCLFRAGDTFTVDLGSINRTALVEGGLPKEGYSPQSVDLSLECVNTGSATIVNYMFQGGSGTAGNILRTDLPGLGIALLDGDDKPVGLGIENAINVPLESNSTSFQLKPYPTKIAGESLESGHYSTQAIVTISLP